MVSEHSSADSTLEITAKPYLSKKPPSSGSSGLLKLQVHITSVVMAAIGVCSATWRGYKDGEQ